jgi:hypothetical protein
MVLRTGSKGEAVRELQENLKALGFYKTTIDGDYGRKTVEAVKAFQERYFVDGIAGTETIEAAERALQSWAVKDRTILVPVPNGLAEIEKRFGKIAYEEAGGGYVNIIESGSELKVVEYDYPVIGRQSFHANLVWVLKAVMEEIKARGLDGEIRQVGTWCPRHKMHDPKRGLSTHSWAIAIDLNWATNAPGTRGDLDAGIVEVFERFGFEWGGRWSYKDPMHFQYATSY